MVLLFLMSFSWQINGILMAYICRSERTWKIREKSGNLKINGYGWQSSENLFILFERGKEGHSLKIV